MAIQEYNLGHDGIYYPMRVNWQIFKDRKLTFMQWQKNVHEDDRIAKEGGTVILEFDTISGWLQDLVTDSIGLGRWFWINTKVNNGHIRRIVCA